MTDNRSDAAARNRELMPNVAKLVDEWREYFPGLKVIWAEDKVTGHKVGERREEDGFVVPAGYFPGTPFDVKGRKK